MRATYFPGGLLVGALLLVTVDSMAETKTPQPAPYVPSKDYVEQLASAGITYQLTNQLLEITVDESKVIRALPSLQDAGVVDASAIADFQTSSTSMAIATVGVTFAASVMDDEYTNNKTLDALRVLVYYVPSGQKAAVKEPCFTFNFTRADFQKAAWDTLSASEFAARAPNFTYSSACAKAINS